MLDYCMILCPGGGKLAFGFRPRGRQRNYADITDARQKLGDSDGDAVNLAPPIWALQPGFRVRPHVMGGIARVATNTATGLP